MTTLRTVLRAAVLAMGVGLVAHPSAQAVPSMGRQTGYQCARCHTVFPELTQFGRQFKLGAFSMTGDKWDAKSLAERIPLSGAVMVSRTSTNSTSAGGASPDEFPQDRRTIAQTVAGYYGGRITENSGALVQYNYDGIERRWGMEMFDARYGRGTQVGGKELAWGVTLNNNPTVSDIWNSTPAWSFPHTETAAPQMPAAPVIDMGLASKVAGVGAYALWDDLLYLEVAGYRTARRGLGRPLSWGQPWRSEELEGSVLKGTAPYWRLALQRESGPHSMAVGTYGLAGRLWQDINDRSEGSNRFRDIGFDANYQYIQGPHTASGRLNYIREKQTYDSSLVGVAASNPANTLKTFRAEGKYFFQRKYGGALQYFRTTGSADDLRYNSGDALFGSSSGSPNSRGWIGELNYLPWQNVKLAARYTRYLEFNGARKDYTPGRNASDNDSLYLMAWLLF